jgi:hypothetical protein
MNELTLDELKIKAKYILDQKSGWKSCQDGSYEMALSYAGYYDLLNEIQIREKALEEA